MSSSGSVVELEGVGAALDQAPFNLIVCRSYILVLLYTFEARAAALNLITWIVLHNRAAWLGLALIQEEMLALDNKVLTTLVIL